MSPTGEVDLEGGVGQGLGDIDTSKMSTSELRKMQEKRNENLAFVDDTVGKAGLAVTGTAIAGSEIAKQYAKNRTMKPPARLTGNYAASNLDKGSGKTLENYKRFQKVLSFARGAGFGIITAAVVGYMGGGLKEIVDIPIHIDIQDMEISEDAQMTIFHYLKQRLVNELCVEKDMPNKYKKRTNEGLIS